MSVQMIRAEYERVTHRSKPRAEVAIHLDERFSSAENAVHHSHLQKVFNEAMNMIKSSLGLKYSRITITRALTRAIADTTIFQVEELSWAGRIEGRVVQDCCRVETSSSS
jgi:hypothetical protein